ncbi:control protein E1B 19K [Human adenovirus 12]|uniref:E1B protein, small T-antigen n=1 Tax=Human adenovirus A serotype 12 TaxID=28282 RepID=E1BS_ADE12|nr:control protein E1B 19K [Human mastadenovirus A]AP_000108.1 E1B 19K [Human mastadenovirus A]P04492.1 RecName: Full=E1B protein, small T-antigen; AltName: Full=E1B 19 kDa protein; Short=E1B-19K [Human adenovirus 12]AAA42498.1 19.1 kD protein [Human adenovirus 12]UNB11238.1 E1B protein, large T-antigen [Human adenovirus 12]WEG77426.1 control protein E1B 19K [Human adenovirus 12]WEG78634.1 control protein E1B 19K [Human adenovirus 12]WEG78956.1 control protein E1B 19K [Human adenovirus 12]
MELETVLQSFQSVRQLLQYTSKNTSGFWRYLFGSTLSKVVNRVKEDYREEFENILADCPGLLASLDLCYHLVFQEKVVRSLDFSSVGRTVASIAFLATILDKWSEKSHLSWDYMLDYMSMQLWRAWLKRRVCIYSLARPLTMPPLPTLQEEKEEERNPAVVEK